MLEKPANQDFLLTDRLQSQYGLERATLEFLPIGNDVNTAAYRVDTDTQGPLYLKLRHGDFNHASVIVPHLLRARGVRQVIAPLLTTTQQEWTTLNEYSLALYPYIEGQNGFQHPLSDEQWVEFGRAVKVLHTLQVIPELINSIPREKYSSVYRDEVKKSSNRFMKKILQTMSPNNLLIL